MDMNAPSWIASHILYSIINISQFALLTEGMNVNFHSRLSTDPEVERRTKTAQKMVVTKLHGVIRIRTEIGIIASRAKVKLKEY